jgi:hypothetical protein
MSFEQHFLQERIYRLQPIEDLQVKDLVKRYLDLFNVNIRKRFLILKTPPEIFYKKKLDNNNELPLGVLFYKEFNNNEEKNIPIRISFDRKTTDRGQLRAEVERDENNKITKVIPEDIVLYYYKNKFDAKYLEDIIVHELNHAKQIYKTPKENYTDTEETYWLDPVEEHNYTSNIIKEIEDHFQESDDNEKQNTLEFVKNLLTGNEKYIYNAPPYIKNRDTFLSVLYRNRNNPKYKNSFQRFYKKIYWLYGLLKKQVEQK